MTGLPQYTYDLGRLLCPCDNEHCDRRKAPPHVELPPLYESIPVGLAAAGSQ